jgi:hypothetical protein
LGSLPQTSATGTPAGLTTSWRPGFGVVRGQGMARTGQREADACCVYVEILGVAEPGGAGLFQAFDKAAFGGPPYAL